MKIYLIDNDKVQKYILPNKVEESYLINYNSGSSKIDNTITIEANGNEWQIRSNGNVNIISNNNTLDSTLLKPYNHYLLKLLGQDKYIILYAVPIADNTNYNLDIRSIDSITIGNDKNCNIIYQSSYIVPLQAKIYDYWIL